MTELITLLLLFMPVLANSPLEAISPVFFNENNKKILNTKILPKNIFGVEKYQPGNDFNRVDRNSQYIAASDSEYVNFTWKALQ